MRKTSLRARATLFQDAPVNGPHLFRCTDSHADKRLGELSRQSLPDRLPGACQMKS